MFYENFMHTYFWVFLVFNVLTLLFNLASVASRTLSDKEQLKRKFALEGVSGPKFTGLIAWTLWFLSWTYT